MTAGRKPIVTFLIMSTTESPAPAPAPDGGTDPSKRLEAAVDFIEDVAWHDHEVCSHCFSRLRSTSELELDDWGNVVEETTYADAATDGWDLEDSPETVANTQPLARKRIVCEECGSVGGLAQSDTLSLDEAVDRVPALVTRIREAGYQVDVNELYALVRKFKTSKHRNDDKRAFAVAAYLAREDT